MMVVFVPITNAHSAFNLVWASVALARLRNTVFLNLGSKSVVRHIRSYFHTYPISLSRASSAFQGPMDGSFSTSSMRH